jgi:hypothetical protein
MDVMSKTSIRTDFGGKVTKIVCLSVIVLGLIGRLLAQAPDPRAAIEFRTDFSKHSVPYDEIMSGGPPKDGIPALTTPEFTTVSEADQWLQPKEPVILLEMGGDARAYPIQILMWHEIVNDVVGGVPVAVTFCPLCYTAIAFERRVDDQMLEFGATGRLRFSNLLMYDRQTESWWQQADGEAVVGRFTGRRLKPLPASIISWADFKQGHAEGRVLSRKTGHERPYGQNPYPGYDDVRRPPFFFSRSTARQLSPMSRVITLEISGEAVAYPFSILSRKRVINDKVGQVPIVVFWAEGTASALDRDRVADGRDIGAATVYSRTIDDRDLSFVSEGGRIIDTETGSEWGLLGHAVKGPLEGRRLKPLAAVNHYWFSWAAFRPQTRVYEASD